MKFKKTLLALLIPFYLSSDAYAKTPDEPPPPAEVNSQAMAMSSIPFSENERHSLGIGGGTASNGLAMALGGQYNFNRNLRGRVIGSTNGDDFNISTGFSFSW